MSKKSKNGIFLKPGLLRSWIVSALSAVGLLVGPTKAQAEAVYVDTSEAGDSEAQDPLALDAIAQQQETIAMLPGDLNFQPERAFQLPSSAASGEVFPIVSADDGWASVPITVPAQAIAPERDFAAQSSQRPLSPVSADPVSADSVSAEPISVESAVIAFDSVTAPTPAVDVATEPYTAKSLPQVALPEVKQAEFVTLALDQSLEEQPTVEETALEADAGSISIALPQPNWHSPSGEMLLALDLEEEDEEENRLSSAGVPLIALDLSVEEEEEEESRILSADVPLIAFDFAAEEEETESETSWLALRAQEEESEKVTPWLALDFAVEEEEEEEPSWLALRAQEEEAESETPWLALRAQEEASEKVTPWLALDFAVEEETESETPWLALRAQEEESEKVTPWLALDFAVEEEEETSSESKAPRLALSTPDAEAPTPNILSRPRLAIDPATDVPQKRTENWLSTTLLELTDREPEDADEAIALVPTPAPTTYDVDMLSQVAITPTYLANGDEGAVVVGDSEVEFVSPESGAFLDIPSTSVVLRFPVGAKIALLANGQEVANDLVGRTSTDPNTGRRTQTWYGVSLLPGDNLLEIVSVDTGEVLQDLPLVVRGKPEELVLLSPRSVPADGRSTSSIRGQLLDEAGNISLWNSVATVRASDGEFLGADYDPDVPGFQVQLQRGEFVAELRSSLDAHLVQLQAQASGYEAFSQVQFVTPQRSRLVSGVVDVRLGARGTDFYDSYRDFLPLDGDNRYELDVDAAVFATGNIGEWLYTGAYNSERPLNENCQGDATLFSAGTGTSCDGYAIYGDDSYSDRLAPSLDSVYLRLERNSPSHELRQDYVMWGDFDTQEFATAAQLFTSTSRQLHGFKANYNVGNLAATALYANNVEGFQRDTIAPDGTSGSYFTSERDIVPGSETVFFELEELERPGSVLSRQPLSRGADYEIDYDRGTLQFNDPVARTSVDDFGQLLVRRIVATYQHDDGSDTNILAGRLQYDLNAERTQESWIGTSYFAENQGTRDFSLYGADARIALGESVQLTAEVARSRNHADADSVIGDNAVSGNAYRVEIDGSAGLLAGRAHFRTTDAGFSNAATTSFVPGQTRYGAQISGSLGESTSIRAQYDHEDNFGSAPQILTEVLPLLAGLRTTGTPLDNSLTTYSVGVGQRFGKVSADIDWIHRDRTDRANNLGSVSSDQLRSRLTYPIANNLTLVAQNELNLSSDVDPIYPSRTLLGLDWQALPWLNVGVNQIFYGGGGNARGNATSLDFTGEHTFASDTTVRGRFSTIDGRNVGGSIGLAQGINLAPGLNLDLGYEKVFSNFGNQTAASTQVSQSILTGNSASALGLSGGESYSVGLSYTDSADFQGSTRFEHRRSSSGTNTVFNLSAVGRLSPSFSVLGDYRLSDSANRNVNNLNRSSALKLGLAYRNPDDDRFNALLRYEHRTNPNALPTTTGIGTNTQDHLFATEAIYAPNWRWELYGKYALRNGSTTVNTSAGRFSNNSTVQLAQARATYRLGYRWDVVGETRWIGGDGHNETGYSIEAGYYPLPDLRLSAGYSGGATDVDFGDNRSAGGFYAGVTAKLGGLFSGFGTQPIAQQQQQESVIEVSDDTVSDALGDLTSEASPLDTFGLSSLSSEPSTSVPVNEPFPSAVEF